MSDAAAGDAAATVSGATPLQAIFLEVEGKVRWRPNERVAWREAAVNDLVSPGTEIRTGLKSRAALRVGKNATVLVDAGTTFQLPTVVQEGETLRTLAAVKTGRVDFKVDKVGFANDFKVVTPQTTLSVRGTGFGVSTGALGGVEVTGARTNAINAIELRYVSSNLRFFLSGAASSSSTRPEPAQNAWFSTLGPPQIVGLIADPKQLEQAASQGQSGNNPTNPQQQQQQASAQTMDAAASNAIDDLLRLQRDGLGEIRGLAAAFDRRFALADPAVRRSLVAASDRDTAMQSVLSAGQSLELAWSGGTDGGSTGPGDDNESLRPTTVPARSRLLSWRSQSTSDVQQMQALDGDLSRGLDAQSTQDVTAALASMGSIDDLWSGEGTGTSTPSLKRQAAEVVLGVVQLNDALQGALTPARQADTEFNALLEDATQERAAAIAIVEPLSRLSLAVQGYQRAVVEALGTGTLAPEAERKLRASVELLQQSQARIAETVEAIQSLTTRLASARSVGERVLLSAAVQATVRGGDIVSEATDLRDQILQSVQEIELARFGGLESAASRLASDGASVLASVQAVEPQTAQAEQAAEQQQAAIESVVDMGEQLELAWSGGSVGGETTGHGGGGSLTSSTLPARDRLLGWQQESEADQSEIVSLRTQLDDAIAQYTVEDVTSKLDAMAAIDDKWSGDGTTSNTGLSQQVSNVVLNIIGMNDALQQALAPAQQADSTFNALFAGANDALDVTSPVAARLSSLEAAVRTYRQSVSQTLGSRTLSTQAARQLSRSVELLQDAQTRIAAAVSAVDSLSARLATAQGVSQRVLLSAALQATIRGASIASEADDLRGLIRQNWLAIESARFGAFYAAAAAGVAAIGDPDEGLAPQVEAESALAKDFAENSLPAADEAETTINQVVTLAAEMDAFWNTRQGNDDFSPKVRMEQLRDLSVVDRASMASMLVNLQGAIGESDQESAGVFLSDMLDMDQKWNGSSTGLLARAEGIHAQIANRAGAIDGAFSTADGSRQNFESLLSQAQANRDAAAQGVTQIQSIQAQLLLYQNRHEALVAAGRGGSEAAQQLAQTRASIENLLAGIESASKASAEATAAVNAATTYGNRVLFSAAANAHAQAAARLAESSGLRDIIRANAEAIHSDYTTGQSAYDAAFPPGVR